MGIIINPRGMGGAGKTEFVRRLLADYGWNAGGQVEPVHRSGRRAPMAYILQHPRGGRPLLVLGHYQRRNGGCDTITLADGGVDEVFRLASLYAGAGHDVLFEGRALNAEHKRSAILAERQPFHLLSLDTPLEECLGNLRRRMKIGADKLSLLRCRLRADHARLLKTSLLLEKVARVESVSFQEGVARARDLLGLVPCSHSCAAEARLRAGQPLQSAPAAQTLD